MTVHLHLFSNIHNRSTCVSRVHAQVENIKHHLVNFVNHDQVEIYGQVRFSSVHAHPTTANKDIDKHVHVPVFGHLSLFIFISCLSSKLPCSQVEVSEVPKELMFDPEGVSFDPDLVYIVTLRIFHGSSFISRVPQVIIISFMS